MAQRDKYAVKQHIVRRTKKRSKSGGQSKGHQENIQNVKRSVVKCGSREIGYA